MKEVKNLAGQYTPEWNFDLVSSDVGIVFSKVFCNMIESTLGKYNKMAYNYYLEFLNTLGIKLRPASPSSGMIIVKATDASDGAYIEKGSSIFADSRGSEGTIIYETLDSLFAVDTRINAIFFTDGEKDTITCVYNFNEEDEKHDALKPFRIFDSMSYDNLQEHEIYFEDNIVFNSRKSDITFIFKNRVSAAREKELPEIFSDVNNVSWQYYNGSKWIDVDEFGKLENGVRIKFNARTQLYKLDGKKSRYIRCKMKKLLRDDITVTSIVYKSSGDKIGADLMFCDDTQTSKKDIFPFGERYTMYNTFSISSEEVFTKKGATIEINAEIQFVKIAMEQDTNLVKKQYKYIMSDMDFADLEPSDIRIQGVVWEYWNGLGWAKLISTDESKEFFTFSDNRETSRTFTFICPDDIEKITVGSHEGNFVRARISSVNNQFDVYANYITPYIHDIHLKYSYPEKGHVCKEVTVKSNINKYKVDVFNNESAVLMKKILCEHPAMYLCLSRPLTEGTIRMFINLEEGIHRYTPPMKWEYCANDSMGDFKWSHIDVMDLTGDFSHSETVTMIGRNDFYKLRLFDKEGYFIRIINPDDKYRNDTNIESRPVISNIKFNAVRIVQRDTHMPEYFSIGKNEENKLCKLSYPNASKVTVWVNEIGKISTSEQDKYVNYPDNDAQPEYDELGTLEKLWIKWKPVSSLVCAGVSDRVYEIDYSKSEILFGNGRNGKIPPDQYSESIRIDYSVCNGSKGNMERHKVRGFVENIENVDSVDNPSPIMGGVDMETIDRAASRMFSQISGGNRLVSLTDFENSICFNDRNIYKVRCVPHFDESSKQCIGITSIAVLPVDYMQGYEKFQGIKNRIWDFIDEKAPATISKSSKIRIFEVEYVEVSIGIDIVIKDFNSYQGVYKGVRDRLEEFLNPVTGNFSGLGWDIGEFPRKEFIYNYIKVVKGIKWIKKINIFTKTVTSGSKKDVDFEQVRMNKFVVPVFGEPEINISVD